MFCSSSMRIHLLRGLGAVALFGLAIYLMTETGAHPLAWLASLALAIGAFFLLRGCPMCWLIGLFETIRKRKHDAF